MFSFLSPFPFLGFHAPPNPPSGWDDCGGRSSCVWGNGFRSRAEPALVGGPVWHAGGSGGRREKFPGTDPVGSIPRIDGSCLAAFRPSRLGSGDQPLEPNQCGWMGAGALAGKEPSIWRPSVAGKSTFPCGRSRLEIRPKRGTGSSGMDDFRPLPKQSVRIPSARSLGSLFANRTLPRSAPSQLDCRGAMGFKTTNGGSRYFSGWKGRFGLAVLPTLGGRTLDRMLLGAAWALGGFGGLELAAQTRQACIDPVAVAARWADQNAPVTDEAHDSVLDVLLHWSKSPLDLNALPVAAWVDLPFLTLEQGVSLSDYRSRGGPLLDWIELDLVDRMDSCAVWGLKHFTTLESRRLGPTRAVATPAAEWLSTGPALQWDWRISKAWGHQSLPLTAPWKGQMGWGVFRLAWLQSTSSPLALHFQKRIPQWQISATLSGSFTAPHGTFRTQWTPISGSRWTLENRRSFLPTTGSIQWSLGWELYLPGRAQTAFYVRKKRAPWETPKWDGSARWQKTQGLSIWRAQWNWTSDSGWRAAASVQRAGTALRWSQSGSWNQTGRSELLEATLRWSDRFGNWTLGAAWVYAWPDRPTLYGSRPYGSQPWVLSASWNRTWKAWRFQVRTSADPGGLSAKLGIRYAPTWTWKFSQKSG